MTYICCSYLRTTAPTFPQSDESSSYLPKYTYIGIRKYPNYVTLRQHFNSPFLWFHR